MNEIAPGDRGVAMVFQNYALYPHMTVAGNIEFPLRSRRVPAAERKELVDEQVLEAARARREVGNLAVLVRDARRRG